MRVFYRQRDILARRLCSIWSGLVTSIHHALSTCQVQSPVTCINKAYQQSKHVSFIYIIMSNPYLYCKDKSLSLGDFFRLAVQLPIAAREQEGNTDALIFDILSTAPTSGVHQVTPSHTNEPALRRWLYVGCPRRTRCNPVKQTPAI